MSNNELDFGSMKIQQIRNLKETANINNIILLNNQGTSEEEEI